VYSLSYSFRNLIIPQCTVHHFSTSCCNIDSLSSMLQCSPDSLLAHMQPCYQDQSTNCPRLHRDTLCHKRKIFRNTTISCCCLWITGQTLFLLWYHLTTRFSHNIARVFNYIFDKESEIISWDVRDDVKRLEAVSCPTAAREKNFQDLQNQPVQADMRVLPTRTKHDGRLADMAINMCLGGLELLVCPCNHRARASIRSQAAAQSSKTLTWEIQVKDRVDKVWDFLKGVVDFAISFLVYAIPPVVRITITAVLWYTSINRSKCRSRALSATHPSVCQG
jgi:hypothetical protein